MQDSGEFAGPQKHNGESPVFIHCMVLEIQLLFWMSSTKCDASTHGERDPHYWWMVTPTSSVVRLPCLARPIIHGGRSLIAYSIIAKGHFYWKHDCSSNGSAILGL